MNLILTSISLGIFFSCATFASDMDSVRQALIYPRKDVLTKIDKIKNGKYLSGLIMARTLVTASLEPSPIHRCPINKPDLNLGCKLILIGNALNSGNRVELREIDTLLSSQDKDYLEKTLPSALISNLLDIPSTEIKSKRTTNILITAENSDFLEEIAKPIVSFEVNNVKGSALFDTGASLTILSQKDASRYQLQPIDSQMDISSYWTGGNIRAKFYLVKKLVIGDVELSNLVVLVGGELNVIGLDIMTKFKSLIISSSEITINLPDPDLSKFEKRCASRVFLGSDFLRLNQYLYFVAGVDGKKTTIAIDSGYVDGEIGSNLHFYENIRTSPRTAILDDAHGPKQQIHYDASVDLEIAGNTTKKVLRYSPDWMLPTPYVMGWLGLSNHTLILNNDKLRACLI